MSSIFDSLLCTKKALSNVYLSLGSNIEDKISYLTQAIHSINEQVGKVITISPCYETEAWGPIKQVTFINCVIKIETSSTPGKLLQKLLAIEQTLGRKREIKYGPRTIDIDILLMGNKIIRQQKLLVPHPLLQERNFVLAPLNDISATVIHPIFKLTVAELLATSKDKGNVNKIKTTISL